MSYRITETAGLVTITPNGDIVDTLPGGLRDALHALIDTDTRDIVIDVAESTYIDSMSLAILVDCKNKLAEKGRSIKLINANEDIATIIDIASLDDLL